GDAAAGVGALAILHGERKEVLPLLGALGGDAGGQDHGAAEPHDDGAVGLLGHLAGLERKGLSVDVELYGVTHLDACPRGSAVCRPTPDRAGGVAARLRWAPGFLSVRGPACFTA